MKQLQEFNYKGHVITIEGNTLGREIIRVDGEIVTKAWRLSFSSKHTFTLAGELLTVTISANFSSFNSGELTCCLLNSQGLIASKTKSLAKIFNGLYCEEVKFDKDERTWKSELEFPWQITSYIIVLILLLASMAFERLFDTSWPSTIAFYGILIIAVISCTHLARLIFKQLSVLKRENTQLDIE
ncbi:hypothetical protein ACSLBF_13775 [Pseudoalteromonas sp. T1lg65]|uniref:hypothetical protein n=1 Tax=Pseudoalteromonas sp. T1lg65 TaxID=2077101 RepID=UPI003F7AA9A7